MSRENVVTFAFIHVFGYVYSTPLTKRPIYDTISEVLFDAIVWFPRPFKDEMKGCISLAV